MGPLRSWHDIPSGSPFSLHNIPFGIITHTNGSTPRPAVAIGSHALDLELFTTASGFRHCSPIQPHQSVFSSSTLNAFAALGRPMHTIVRKYIESVFLLDGPFPDVLKDNAELQRRCLIPLDNVTMHFPMEIGDYTDFYAGLHHAFNCGSIFRGPANALQPNYRHMPVAYHGRASSVVVSGTPIRRPRGQILEDPSADVKKPVLAQSRRLDFELELGCFLCKSSELGEPIGVDEAKDYLFGVVLLNDWSARDFQAWEAVPLGPFTSKNFASSVSPWIVLMDALEPFRCEGISNDVTEVLEYLREGQKKNVHDMKLQASVTPKDGKESIVTRSNGRNLLWSFSQMLAHHTAGGCNVNVGDLLGSGTISGTEPGQYGSLLERSKGGKEKMTLENGGERRFIEDGDTIKMSCVCGDDPDALVGFGEVTGTVLPAKT